MGSKNEVRNFEDTDFEELIDDLFIIVNGYWLTYLPYFTSKLTKTFSVNNLDEVKDVINSLVPYYIAFKPFNRNWVIETNGKQEEQEVIYRSRNYALWKTLAIAYKRINKKRISLNMSKRG